MCSCLLDYYILLILIRVTILLIHIIYFALDGADIGGWNVIVKVLPHEDLEFTTDQLTAMSISHFKKTR